MALAGLCCSLVQLNTGTESQQLLVDVVGCRMAPPGCWFLVLCPFSLEKQNMGAQRM